MNIELRQACFSYQSYHTCWCSPLAGRALHNQPQSGNVSGALQGKGLAAIAFWAPDMNLFRVAALGCSNGKEGGGLMLSPISFFLFTIMTAQ